MKLFINIIIFWALMTYAISMGDMFGIILCLVGFLIMMKFIEDLEESDYKSNINKKTRKTFKKRTRARF